MIRTLGLTISALALATLPTSAIARDQNVRVGNLLDGVRLLEKVYWVVVRGRIIN